MHSAYELGLFFEVSPETRGILLWVCFIFILLSAIAKGTLTYAHAYEFKSKGHGKGIEIIMVFYMFLSHVMRIEYGIMQNDLVITLGGVVGTLIGVRLIMEYVRVEKISEFRRLGGRIIVSIFAIITLVLLVADDVERNLYFGFIPFTEREFYFFSFEFFGFIPIFLQFLETRRGVGVLRPGWSIAFASNVISTGVWGALKSDLGLVALTPMPFVCLSLVLIAYIRNEGWTSTWVELGKDRKSLKIVLLKFFAEEIPQSISLVIALVFRRVAVFLLKNELNRRVIIALGRFAKAANRLSDKNPSRCENSGGFFCKRLLDFYTRYISPFL